MSAVDHRPFADALAQRQRSCAACREGQALPFDFTMAFQPIVDLSARRAWGYEALVRGIAGQGADTILGQVDDHSRYAFDQACRVKAIELAAALLPDDGTKLSINFKPGAVYEPRACIRATLDAANRTGFDRTRLMFEFTEDERMTDVGHVRRIIEAYRQFGFMTALDDFGAGYAGLSLLSELQPDLIKLDMSLLRGIDTCPARQSIVRGLVAMTGAMGIQVLAEGLETRQEVACVRALGITLAQGYYFARPLVGAVPDVRLD